MNILEIAEQKTDKAFEIYSNIPVNEDATQQDWSDSLERMKAYKAWVQAAHAEKESLEAAGQTQTNHGCSRYDIVYWVSEHNKEWL